MRLVKFAKECKDKKLKAFSSYRSLKEVLKKYGIDSNGTDTIPLFTLQTHEIQDSDEHLYGENFSQVKKLRVFGRG